MIAKNIKGKSFKGCVSYVMNETAVLLEAEGVFADSTKNIIRSFTMQRSGRKEIKQPVGHIPISFSPEDKGRMTDEFMVQLAKEYMQEMGISNTQYIIVRHNNTDNPHLHIVYNRIDNDLKLISVNNDYKRNIKTCKKLKDKYDLTYGEGKEKVKREKLNDPDRAKYYIYDAIKAVLPYCQSPNDLKSFLKQAGIETEFKLRRTTGEVEGISFRFNDIAFKGSEVDRKFSYANLKKVFKENLEEAKKQIYEEYLQKLAEQKMQQEAEQKAKREAEERVSKEAGGKPKIPTIGGVELTAGQWQTLQEGGYIFLENINRKDGKGKFSAYIFLNDERKAVFSSKDNPDTFVKYGKYEMRIRDKILVEKGFVTKAKVKWYGGDRFAHPYLWKPDIVKGEGVEKISGYLPADNSEYCESWGYPRIEKTQKEEQNQKVRSIPVNPKKNRGRRR